jgi:uncharacterized membrane protein
MFFFFLLGVLTALAVLGQYAVAHAVAVAAAMRWALSGSLVFFGIDHLRKPGRYLPMMPTIVPAPRVVVLFTGVCELAGAMGLMIPALRVAAAWALAVYFVCVFPANIRNALQGLSTEGLPSARWYYWVRLLFQPIAVWWPLYAAGIITWPFAWTLSG